MKENRKNLINLFLFVVLIIATIWIVRTNSNSTINKNDSDFAVKDTAHITKIFLADMGGGRALLEKTSNGWMVNGKYAVSQSRIEMLMDVICKLEVKYPVAESFRESVIRDLATGGTKVEIYLKNKRKPARIYTVGGPTEDQLGTYMIMNGKNSRPYVMHIPGFNGYISGGYYFTSENDWRTKKIFSYSIPELASLQVYYSRFPDSSFTIQINKNRDVFLKTISGEIVQEADMQLLKAYISNFLELQFMERDYTISPSQKDSILAQSPFAVINASNHKGEKQTLKLYFKPSDLQTRAEIMEGVDKERYYGITADREGEMLILSALTMEGILWKISNFKMKK